ncbi:MAG: pyridoxamine 5'-phosphate oxidase family protein [Planctomycetota bacterium]|jgi:general stress protein 26
MTEEEARQFALGLMETSPAAYLASIDSEGFPQIRAMLNLMNHRQYPKLAELFTSDRDGLVVYFTTNTSSEKMRQMEANPKVAVYFCHPEKYHGLMLRGSVEIVSDQRLKHDIWHDGWEQYYPEGPDDPDYTILRLAPTLAKGWHGEGRFEFRVG